MRKLNTIQDKYLLNHAYATDTPDKSGANHFYTVMDAEDRLIMGYIRFQQGARGGLVPPNGLRDDDLLEILTKHRLDLDIYHRVITPENVKACHDAGIEVNVWTVDTLEDAQRVIACGVDYITSNILE